MRCQEKDLPLEVSILAISGMAMLLTSGLLCPVFWGWVAYSENGFLGLLLILFALQTITLGKTPFGAVPRSPYVFTLGVLIAAVGIVTCCVPVPTLLPRILLILCFGPGGLLLLVQMCLDKNKLRLWIRYGGVFRLLIVSCGLVYVLSMVVGLLCWNHELLSTPGMAAVLLLFGFAIFFLAWVLNRVYSRFPEAAGLPAGSFRLSTDHALLVLMGVFMLLLGGLLIPVSWGWLPFSASGQLGLLMVIFAVQMLASGSTPLGAFRRTWPLVGCGLVFAALGIVSCILPDKLVAPLTVFVGVLNILGGAIGLWHMWVVRPRRQEAQDAIPPILVRLAVTQFVLNLLSIMFGLSMLMPGLVSGPVIGVILAANGGVLLYLLRILLLLDRMRAPREQVPATEQAM